MRHLKRFALPCLTLLTAATCAAEGPSWASYQQHAMTHEGDPDSGRKIYKDTVRAKCADCHVAEGNGGLIGPDLSKIGGKFDRVHLIESLLEPSRQIVEGYQTNQIITVDGIALMGIIRSQDDDKLVIEDAAGKKTIVPIDDIEDQQVSDVSIMPAELQNNLSEQEFTDLIAYLETLRLGVDDKWGNATRGPIRVAEGFQIETVTTGITGAVTMDMTPDGRLLICEQTGALRVIKDGKLLPDPMLVLDVESYWERGLLGIAIDPDFSVRPWIYVCYVTDQPYTHHVISRFRVDGDVADPASEQILLEGDDQDVFGGFQKAGHQGGEINFGPDGCLYIAIGEQTAKSPSQDLDALQGKILRINADGSIPKDNPFYDQTEGKYRSIWTIGNRNPFTFAFDPADGKMLINDVGGKFEEVNVAWGGENFGWGIVDHGISDLPGLSNPIHLYPESSIGGAAFGPSSAGDLVAGRYFFSDFVQGWVRSIDPNDPDASENFVTGLRQPVDLQFAPDGTLYVLLRNAWVMDDKFGGHTGSLMRVSKK